MEAVAATASVVGILTFVAQSIESIIRLRDFYSKLSSSSRTVDRFLHDISALLHTLYGTENLLSKWPKYQTDVNITSLHIQLEECSKDLSQWLATAQAMRSGTSRGGKSWFKNFWNAVNKSTVKDIRADISRHRHAINTSLALIGR